MFNLSKNASTIAKGIFYVLVGAILALSSLGILTGSLMNYLIAAVALYFIAYGFFLSGLYDNVMNLINSK